jgi:voltage-gated potassium channel
MNKTILNAALMLDRSKSYRRTKSFVNTLLNDYNYPYKKYLDIFIIFLIITSIMILVYGVKHPVPHWMERYDLYFVTFVFLAEYLARLWVHNDFHKLIIDEYKKSYFLRRAFDPWRALREGIAGKVRYTLTPFAIIDLMAILPAYRPFAILRIFVLFRFFKLLRYTKNIKQFIEVMANKRFELYTLLFLLIFVVLSAGIAIFILEEQLNEDINNPFDAIYWAMVTIATVGYGDIAPVTAGGRVISMVVMLMGITMISFMTSVIVSAFSEKLHELKENRLVEMINKNKEFLVVCGYGQMTKMFLRQMGNRNYNYIILDNDIQRVNQAIKNGYNAIYDDASRHETLVKFNTQFARITVLCLTNSDIENIYITLNAKSISPNVKVIARVNNNAMVSKFKRAGADYLLRPIHAANSMMLMAISYPSMYKVIHAILTGKDIAIVDEVLVEANGGLEGRRIDEIDFKEKRILFIGIQGAQSDTFVFNPPMQTVLKAGDVIVVMGMQLSIDYFREYYRGSKRR